MTYQTEDWYLEYIKDSLNSTVKKTLVIQLEYEQKIRIY